VVSYRPNRNVFSVRLNCPQLTSRLSLVEDCPTHADQQQWNSCRRTYCGCVVRRKSCQLLIWEGDGHCQRQGWYPQLSMPVVDLTMTDAPGMQLCTPLVARQDANATGLVHVRYGHIVWRWWWDVRLCSRVTVTSEWDRIHYLSPSGAVVLVIVFTV